MGRERDRLSAELVTAEAARRDREQGRQAERDRLRTALDQARHESESAAHLGVKQAEQIRALRAELERQRAGREADGEEQQRSLAALRREWEAERRRWLELLEAGRPEALCDRPVSPTDLPTVPQEDAVRPLATRPAPKKGRSRTSLRPRPQANSYHDPAIFRDHLEQWVGEALAALQVPTEPADRVRSKNPAWADWLEYEIRTARQEMAHSLQESAGESAVPINPA